MTLPESLSSSYRYYNPDDKCLYIRTGKKVASGDTFSIYAISESGTVSTYTLTNSTGNSADGLLVYDGYYYFGHNNNSSGYIGRISLTDSTDYISTYCEGTLYILPRYVSKGNVIYVLRNSSGSFDAGATAIWDTANNEVKICGIRMPMHNTFYNEGIGAFIQNSGALLYEKFFNYLATINNLDETVTKTAAQTMKITYTITEE